MKRLFAFLATFSLVETIGRRPALAGILMLLGVGGGAGIANLITPSIIPQPASYFNQNQSFGTTTNGLKPNGGAGGSMYFPTDVTGSFGLYFEATVDPTLPYGASVEYPFNGLFATANAYPGLPTFFFQKLLAGQAGTQWLNAPGPQNALTLATMTSGGSGYNTGFYTFTATGGGCNREPSGVWQGGTTSAQVTDPGFGCTTGATANPATIPGDGAQQATGLAASPAQAATTCTVVNSQMQVTVNLVVAHGLTPGMTYTLQSFGTGFTGYDGTYTALPGTTGSTLVGTTGAGTCPTSPVDTSAHEGTALSGTGASTITMPVTTATAPFASGQTGITTQNGQHICGILGEYGDNSPFPGARFRHMVDDQGNALPGAPSLVPWPNQGTANYGLYLPTRSRRHRQH